MEKNKKGAQLIFTSHDLSTMNSDVFRRDEIWFVAKGKRQNSKLYSLVEFKNKKGKGKTVTKDTGKENKKPLTKYHDTFNEHYKNYTSDELDDKLRQSKSNNNNNLEEQLYLAAVENGFNSLSDLSQSRVLHYATENNLDIPK